MRNKAFADRRPRQGFKRPKIKPEADPSLKKVFDRIGIPDKTPFVPDAYQVESVNLAGKTDCLVTAPTGAGKTWIAEQAMRKIFNDGKRSWYASPLKALSNAKYMEFGGIFGADHVGILTGDRKENSDAGIIVGTTEVLRNQLYDTMHMGVSLPFDFVVLDEAHFLGDEDRGVVWEEIIIYLPERIPLLLLSATIGNAQEIADWISSIRKKECRVVQETKRPVPLFPLLLHPTGKLLPLVAAKGKPNKAYLHKKVENYVNSKRPQFLAPPNRLPPFNEILRILKKFKLLPAIFFLKSRSDCDQALEICNRHYMGNNKNKEALSLRISELIAKSPHLRDHRQLRHLAHLGIGAHHSGHLPAWKLVLEKLMSEGLMDAIFATSTVAAGVNFPARTIVILNSDRFNGRDFSPLTSTEFHQMAGRAGRRGMDNIGFALLIPGKFMNIRYMAKLTAMPPAPVNSQIRINFSMVLNLLLSHLPADIEELLAKSFAEFQMRKKKKRQALSAHDILIKDFNRHLKFLHENDFVSSDGKLTHDGLWASQLRVDQPLLIAEGFRKGIFPQNDPALLAATVALFVNEDETDDKIEAVYTPNVLTKNFRKVKKQLHPLTESLLKNGFDVRPPYLRPMATVFAWAKGHPWETVLHLSEMEAGNLVMLLLRTADNLRHIVGLKDYFPEASATAKHAIDLLLKDPVIFEES